jgi:rhamnosyltransferase subunit B
MTIGIAVTGSGGDLFPFLALADRLRNAGHETCIVAPQMLAVVARASGHPVVGVGPRSDSDFGRHPSMLTTRFDGGTSWRTAFDHYFAPMVHAWEPTERVFKARGVDMVITHPFAHFGALAAVRLGIPWHTLQLFPGFLERATGARGVFAPRLSSELRSAERELGLSQSRRPSIDWMRSPTLNLVAHHEWLAAPELNDAAVDFVGFPYRDQVVDSTSYEHVLDWIDRAPSPVVIFSMGTFLGQSRDDLWAVAAEAATRLDISVVLLNKADSEGISRTDRILATPFAPLTEVAPRSSAIVHLGGLGFTYGAVRAGKPTVVVPVAFDQPFNARIIERAGLGRDAGPNGWARVVDRLRTVLSDTALASAAATAAGRMGSADTLTDSIADRFLAIR